MPGVSLRKDGDVKNAHSCYAGGHIAVQGRAAPSCLLQCLEDLRMTLSQAALDASQRQTQAWSPLRLSTTQASGMS